MFTEEQSVFMSMSSCNPESKGSLISFWQSVTNFQVAIERAGLALEALDATVWLKHFTLQSPAQRAHYTLLNYFALDPTLFSNGLNEVVVVKRVRI